MTILAREMTSEQPPFEWTPYAEFRLIQSMYGLKLHGAIQSFNIVIIWERFKKVMGVDIPIATVKEKIKTYYNLDNPPEEFLAEQEITLPQREFSLPEDEFPQVYAKPTTSSRRSK